jgi:phenylacetate-CoA ligase
MQQDMDNEYAQDDVYDTLFGLPLNPQENDNISDIQQKLQSFSPTEAVRQLKQDTEHTWISRGQKRALKLFHLVAKRVPAYRDFLSKNNINPNKIKTFEDFLHVPVTDKENYINQYPLEELVWDGALEKAHVIVASSGSYGSPHLWPRGHLEEAYVALEHELSTACMFNVERHSTLVVVCFAMGMHIAGTTTARAMVHLHEKGYPVTVVTPGYATESIITLVSKLGNKYDQVILAGYPPHIKEVIDRGRHEAGIEWEKKNIKFLFAGEGFNESWRDYMANLVGGDPSRDFINIYGSADAALMGQETQASIAIRRFILQSRSLQQKAFGTDRTPFLYQYYPEHRFFEEVEGELVITGVGRIPLIRYNIHDQGGVLTQQKIAELSTECNQLLQRLQEKEQLWNLPFVYVFGRSNQMVVLYGANVYLDHVRHALEDKKVREYVSGKVILRTEEDENKNQRFHIDIECAQDVDQNEKLCSLLARHIKETLLKMNSEYKVVHDSIGEKAYPMIHLYSHGHDLFRPPDMKQKWSIKGKL